MIGYIIRGRGISIHHTGCPNMLNLAEHPERRVAIEWETESHDRFFVRVVVDWHQRHAARAVARCRQRDQGHEDEHVVCRDPDARRRHDGVGRRGVQDLPHL